MSSQPGARLASILATTNYSTKNWIQEAVLPTLGHFWWSFLSLFSLLSKSRVYTVFENSEDCKPRKDVRVSPSMGQGFGEPYNYLTLPEPVGSLQSANTSPIYFLDLDV